MPSLTTDAKQTCNPSSVDLNAAPRHLTNGSGRDGMQLNMADAESFPEVAQVTSLGKQHRAALRCHQGVVRICSCGGRTGCHSKGIDLGLHGLIKKSYRIHGVQRQPHRNHAPAAVYSNLLDAWLCKYLSYCAQIGASPKSFR